MSKLQWTKCISIILVVSIMLSLVGCGVASVESSTTTSASTESQQPTESHEESEQNSDPDSTPEITPEENSPDVSTTDNQTESSEQTEEDSEAIAQAEEEERQKAEEAKRLKEHNSFSIMYYLAITAEEIRTSKENRLILDDIYTSLLNDINPGAIDEITQDHLKNLRDIIKSYLQISTKRERLQYLYNQNKAAAIRSAVPNPLAVLALANSTDWRKLAMTTVYTSVDSYNSYKNASASADKEFLMSGWDLDDEEVATVQKNRDRAFDYMVDMVQEYNLDGLKTLNEAAITKFTEICAIEAVPEKIARLEAEKGKYCLLGNYWLELASCYFENSQYDKCLESVLMYSEVFSGIYRKDYNLVKVLPMAIVAAQQTCSGEQYVSVISKYADAIIENTEISTDDWSTRYFAAQTYLDLYAKTNQKEFLEKAYQIAYDNMTVLLGGQRTLNTQYFNDVKANYVTVKEPDYNYMSAEEKKVKKQEYKDEQKSADAYNDALKKARKTELPSLYEPLILNCELFFALADKLNISDSQKANIEAILKTDTNGIFVSKPINDAFSFNHKEYSYSIELTKDKIIIPADLLTADASIIATVMENGKSETFDDCSVTKVEREGGTIDTFTVTVSSKAFNKHEWTADSKVSVVITYGAAYDKTVTFNFVVTKFEHRWYWFDDKVVFEAL